MLLVSSFRQAASVWSLRTPPEERGMRALEHEKQPCEQRRTPALGLQGLTTGIESPFSNVWQNYVWKRLFAKYFNFFSLLAAIATRQIGILQVRSAKLRPRSDQCWRIFCAGRQNESCAIVHSAAAEERSAAVAPLMGRALSSVFSFKV
jgi:hypothetical protein